MTTTASGGNAAIKTPSEFAGTNRVQEADPNTVGYQTPKDVGKDGNKVSPQTKAGG